MASRPSQRPNRRPVEQNFAERYLLLMIISFGASVTLTRFYLELTGFPKIGNGTLHIAHVLWGGLLLYVGALFPLIFANRWAYRASAVLTGIGVGLFIDEVGKFITESTDYFYPIALPIIYAFILLSVWIYLQVKREEQRDTRAELYRALDDMKEVLDNDLDANERTRIVKGLQGVVTTETNPNTRRLAAELLDYIQAEGLDLVEWRPNALERFAAWLQGAAAHRIGRRSHRVLVLVGQAAVAVTMYFNSLLVAPPLVRAWADLEYVIRSGREQYVTSNPYWLALNVMGMVFVGTLLTVGVLSIIARREAFGVRVGIFALLWALTIVDLITFYFSQFYTTLGVLFQLVVLFLCITYRRRYLNRPPAPPPHERASHAVAAR